MYDQLASEEKITRTIEALIANGIKAEVVDNKDAARKRVLELIPETAEVMTMSSMTLEAIGLTKEINESGRYNSVKTKLAAMDREKDSRKMQQMGAAPEYAIGSVHAVTESGQLVVASNTGSQLPAYAYGADKVIWVVGTQKIVANLDEAFKRIYEYSLPLESERAKKAYGRGSSVNKVLVINKEIREGRLSLIFVRELLGF